MAKKSNTEQEKSLDNFDWDSQQDFFGVTGTAVETEEEEDVVTKVKEEEDDDELEKKAKSKEKSEIDEEDEEEDEVFEKSKKQTETFFEDKVDKDGNAIKEDEDEEEEVDVVDLIKSEILLNAEIKDDEELTTDRIKELFDEEKEAYAEQVINGFKDDAGEDGVAFIKYVTAGGDSKKFFSLYREAATVPEVDLEEEDGQDELLTFYLDRYEKLDKEDIKDRLAWLQENGKKKKYALKAQKEITEDYESRKEELLKNQREATRLQEQKRKEASDNLKSKLLESAKIGNYTITKDDKKSLLGDITKATVKIGENRFITPLQHKIGEIFKDPEKLILLAKVVMSDFDTSDIETQAASKVARKVKGKLSTSGKEKLSSQPKQKVRTLSEFFD